MAARKGVGVGAGLIVVLVLCSASYAHPVSARGLSTTKHTKIKVVLEGFTMVEAGVGVGERLMIMGSRVGLVGPRLL